MVADSTACIATRIEAITRTGHELQDSGGGDSAVEGDSPTHIITLGDVDTV
jgi:hypothetical protein